MTVAEMVVALRRLGVVVPGRERKTVSDALRWEIGKGRVRRTSSATPNPDPVGVPATRGMAVAGTPTAVKALARRLR
jgi:hypothetical protein